LITCGPATVIALSGDVDQDTTYLFVDLAKCVAREWTPPRLVLDLAEVTFFGAAGLRALVRVRDLVTAAGGELLLRDPSCITRRVLEVAARNENLRIEVTVGSRGQRDTGRLVAGSLASSS
jgi:anti-anti-sigma factor